MVFKMNPPGTPLPDNHPLKGGMIIFGGKRPSTSAKPSTPVEQLPPPIPNFDPPPLPEWGTVDALMQQMSLLPGLPMQADPFNNVQPMPGEQSPQPEPKPEQEE